MQCVPPPCVSVSVMLLSVVAEVTGIYKCQQPRLASCLPTTEVTEVMQLRQIQSAPEIMAVYNEHQNTTHA